MKGVTDLLYVGSRLPTSDLRSRKVRFHMPTESINTKVKQISMSQQIRSLQTIAHSHGGLTKSTPPSPYSHSPSPHHHHHHPLHSHYYDAPPAPRPPRPPTDYHRSTLHHPPGTPAPQTSPSSHQIEQGTSRQRYSHHRLQTVLLPPTRSRPPQSPRWTADTVPPRSVRRSSSSAPSNFSQPRPSASPSRRPGRAQTH